MIVYYYRLCTVRAVLKRKSVGGGPVYDASILIDYQSTYFFSTISTYLIKFYNIRWAVFLIY